MAKRAINLRLVAMIQRQLLWLVLGMIALNIGNFAIQDPSIALVFALSALVVQLAAIIQVCRLARALGSGVVIVILVGFLMLLPLISLLVLLLENSRATRKLKAAGLKVGLMGVSPTQLHKLEDGRCNGCGYDLVGLDGQVCPECGLEEPLALSKAQQAAILKGACLSCGYDLAGLDSGARCPECGTDKPFAVG